MHVNRQNINYYHFISHILLLMYLLTLFIVINGHRLLKVKLDTNIIWCWLIILQIFIN